jgi:hypothetical protein
MRAAQAWIGCALVSLAAPAFALDPGPAPASDSAPAPARVPRAAPAPASPAVAQQLFLDAHTIEPELNVAVIAPGAPYATATLVTAAVDWAATPRFQLGAAITQSAAPDAGYTALTVDAIFAFSHFAGVRLDLAVERRPFLTGQDLVDATLGLAFPVKLRLGRYVALQSARTGATAFVAPSFFAPDDVVTIQLTGHVVSVGLPFGVTVAPVKYIALSVRTGYRRYFLSRLGLGVGPDAVPLAADVTATPIRWLDVGFTFAIPGKLSDPTCVPPCPDRGWSSVLTYQAWARARF